MRFEDDIEIKSPPPLQRIERIEDIDKIKFVDGLAEVEVPVELVEDLPLKNEERFAGPRLSAVMRSIRDRGYVGLSPIVCRIGARGRWIVVDGGHRLTAIRQISNEFMNWFFRRDLGNVTFILYTTPLSFSKHHPGKRARPRAAKSSKTKPLSQPNQADRRKWWLPFWSSNAR